MKSAALLIVGLILGAIAWSSWTDKSPTPVTTPPGPRDAAATERSVASLGEFSRQAREGARMAAQDYVLGISPEAQIVGMSSMWISGTTWLVGVDVGPPRYVVVEIVSRLFVPPAGPAYWRATPLVNPIARLLGSAMTSRMLDEAAVDKNE